MLRRSLLTGAAAIALLAPQGAGAFLFRGGASAGGGGGGSVLTTFTFVNTSGSTQAANAPTQMFGLAFKKGDIPSGTYPQMQVASDSTQVPLSLGCYSYWSDGSLKFCSALARCPKSIAGSGTLTVNLMSGGSVPSASGRTLTEVYSELVQVNVAGVSALSDATNGSNLSGTWNAILANDANNYEQAVYCDGPAGKVWRIRTHFVQSGSSHGQLECDHFVQALNDSSGALGGFRYLPRVCQPWYDVDSPANPAKRWRAFSTFAWQHGSGPTTVTPPWPYSPLTYTWSGGVFTATGISGYYRGQGGHAAILPCYLSGTIPGGASGTVLYFAHLNDGNDNFVPTVGSSGGNSVTPTGSGTGTINFVPTCLHFGSQFGATAGAKYNFFQGAGSLTAESTIQVQFNQTYLRSTKLVPPFDLTLSPTDNSWNYDWDPVIPGPVQYDTSGTGERNDIGPLNSWQARHFYSQSALSEKLIRTIGFASAHLSYLLRDGTTHAPVNVGNPSPAGGAYSGLPTSTYNSITWNGPGLQGGFTAPPANNFCMGFVGNDTTHMPSCAYYAYLVTGEPQFLDMLLDEANGAVFTQFADAIHRNPTNPSTRIGVTDGFNINIRECAWGFRNQAQAAAVTPASFPDGTDLSRYITDNLSASAKRANDVMTSGIMSAYAVTNGLWTVTDVGAHYAETQAWQVGYFTSAMCFAAADNSDALTWLQSQANWLAHRLTTFGGWHLYDFEQHNGPGITYGGAPSSIITADADYGINIGMTLSYTNANPGIFTIVPDTGNGWTLTNGDKIIFGADGAGTSWPTGLAADTPYYVVNKSGSTCNLAASPGGSGLATSGAGSIGGAVAGPYIIAASPIASNVAGVPAGGTGPDGYLANVRAGAKWMTALGVTGLTAVLSDGDGRVTANSVSFTGDPKYAFQASY